MDAEELILILLQEERKKKTKHVTVIDRPKKVNVAQFSNIRFA